MTDIDKRDGGVSDLICRGRRPQICHPCADRFAQDGAKAPYQNMGARLGASRVPIAAAPLRTPTSIAAVARRFWRRRRSPTNSRGPSQANRLSSDISPTENATNIPRSPSCNCSWFRPGSPPPAISNVPPSDRFWARSFRILMRARPIKRRVTHAAIAALPIEFRPALLAGLARVEADPAVLHDLRKATLLRGQRNFDKFCREAKFELPEAAASSHQ